MAIITCDFETYYSKEYSLRRMSEIEYILDPRYQTIMAAIKVGDGPNEAFIGHDAIAAKFATIDWTRAAFLAHNTRFDGAILSWRFGITPKLYLDTLSMARAITHAVLGRSSLEKVSEYLGLPPKGHEVVNAIGKRLENFLPHELSAYVDYCLRDNENCYSIFQRLRPAVPAAELKLIDTVMRMFIEPQVKLNPNVLAEYGHQIRAEKAAIMAQVAHIDKSVFSSNQQFAALLESYGVEVPRKISPTTGLETFALAKGDREFKELCEDDTQPLAVQALLAARVNAKSTLEETRTQSMLNLSLREWEGKGTGWAPVPLKYYGAHTGRLSGDGGFNWQNFRRGSQIRAAVEAPPGYRILHRDASQIEARMVAWLARCEKLINAFANGEDIYSQFASTVYGRRVSKADKGDRFVGKTSILGLGYGMGADKFRHTLFIGNGGMSLKIDVEEAKRIVYLYRRTYPEIPGLWDKGTDLLEEIISLGSPIVQGARKRHHVAVQPEAFPVVKPGAEALWLPNGMAIAFPNLRHEHGRDMLGKPRNEIIYDGPYNDRRKMFGGKMVENVSQALSRIIVTDIADRMKTLTGYDPWLSTHDSLDYCVPVSEVAWFDAELDRQFAIRPSWAPDLPLASEGGWGVTLQQAERGDNT